MNSKKVLSWISNEDKIKRFLMKWSHIFFGAKLYYYTNDDLSLYRIGDLSLCFRSSCVDGERLFLTYENYCMEDNPEFKVPISFFDEPQAYYDKILEQYKKDRRNY